MLTAISVIESYRMIYGTARTERDRHAGGMTVRSRRIPLAAVIALTSCVTAKPLTLIDVPSGQQVDLQRNQEMILELAANPSTGYRWQIELTASAVLDKIGDEQFMPASSSGGAVGAGGTTVWHFRATRSGTDLLRLVYRRPFEKNVPAAKSVVYTINVR